MCKPISLLFTAENKRNKIVFISRRGRMKNETQKTKSERDMDRDGDGDRKN